MARINWIRLVTWFLVALTFAGMILITVGTRSLGGPLFMISLGAFLVWSLLVLLAAGFVRGM